LFCKHSRLLVTILKRGLIKVQINGVAGYIGAHVTNTFLEKGYEVFGIDNLSIGDVISLSEAHYNDCQTLLNESSHSFEF
jgi:UDP-glucose 4-epimerase